MSHGRAVMPWGKYKGVRIRLLPDSYLSWLTKVLIGPPETGVTYDNQQIGSRGQWKWLRDSLIAEIDYRGMRADLAGTPDPVNLEFDEWWASFDWKRIARNTTANDWAWDSKEERFSATYKVIAHAAFKAASTRPPDKTEVTPKMRHKRRIELE